MTTSESRTALVGEHLRLLRRDVDAHLGHRLDGDGIDLVARHRAGGAHVDRPVGQGGEEAGGHLRAPGVVDAHEQDGGAVGHELSLSRRARPSPSIAPTSWAAMNHGTSEPAMPEKESVNSRADRHRRVGEGRRRREQVGAEDPRGDDEGQEGAVGQRDDRHQAGRRDDLAEETSPPAAVGVRPRHRGLLEHQVGEDGAGDASRQLGADVRGAACGRDRALRHVGERHRRVERSPADGQGDGDQDAEHGHRGDRVEQQLEPDVIGELDSRDPRTDDRHEEGGGAHQLR